MYYDLVQNRREEGKIKHHRIIYMGSLSSLDSTARGLLLGRIEQLLSHHYYPALADDELEELARAYVGKILSRQSGHSQPYDPLSVEGYYLDQSQEERLDLRSFSPFQVREVGSDWLCFRVLEELGLRDFLIRDQGWSLTQANWAMLSILGRLIYPSSERKTVSWLKDQSSAPLLLDQVLSIHREGLYQAALRLLACQEELEDYLYQKLDEWIGFSPTPYLYDLTNTYFEGRMLGSELARYGRSKERRSDAPLVSIGLLANREGFYRRAHFYPGNVSEPATFSAVIEYLKDQGGVLTDAGIATEANIEQLAREQIPYMCVVRQGFSQYEADFASVQGFEHQASNGQSYQVWLVMKSHSFTLDGKTYTDQLIFVKSEAKQAKEDGMVALQKNRFETGLTQIRDSLTKPRGHKKIEQVHQRIGRLRAKYTRVSRAFEIQTRDDGIQITALTWTYDQSHEQRNGCYIIRTSLPVSDPKDAWKTYHQLTTIEAINRSCKTDLNMRPVFHQKDRPIQAHLFLTLIAYNVLAYIRYKLKEKGINHSWKEVIRLCNTHKSMYASANNSQGEYFLISKWSRPENKAMEIYQALGIDHQPFPGFALKVKNQNHSQGP